MKKDKHEFLTNKEDIISWLDSMKIKKGAYVIFDDLSVSVNANVILENKKLKYLPIQFNDVLGNFDISHNQLTSLKGCPQNISGNFYANNNLLTTLEYAPKEIGELYNVSENQIKKLGKLDISCEIFQINDNPLTQIKFDEIKHLQTQYLYISSHLYRTFDYKTEDGRINFNIDPDYIEVSFERFKTF